MRITTKGQVTIPLKIREKFGITPNTEVDFIERDGQIYLKIIKKSEKQKRKFNIYRGIATVKMTTEEILKLTRGDV